MCTSKLHCTSIVNSECKHYIVKWLFSHERLTKTAPKCNPKPDNPNPCFQIKKTPEEHSLQIKWVWSNECAAKCDLEA